MNIIQTLFIDKKKNPAKDSFGWASPVYHLMSWALSCLQLKDTYGHAQLYTNEPGADILINRIKLPYTEVTLSLCDFDLPHTNLWALPKIHTYSLQNEPFLHVDGDVFLFKRFPEKLMGSKLIAQNLEVATEYYISTQRELENEFSYFPDCVKRDFEGNDSIRAVNAGILGGHDVCFIQDYTRQAFEYIFKNTDHLDKINCDRFNVFFEQHLFYALARQKGLQVDYLFPDVVGDNQYQYLGEFHEVPFNKSYIHLLGHYKKDEYTCKKMAYKLRQLYPEYFYRIVEYFQKVGAPFFMDSFYGNIIKGEQSFFAVDEKAVMVYHRKEISSSSFDTTAQQEVETIPAICILSKVLHENYFRLSSPVKDNVAYDFKKFKEQLSTLLAERHFCSEIYLLGRDLSSDKWYSTLFADESTISTKVIERCMETHIIKSQFDWGGLVNKFNRVGVKYYEELEIGEGCFYNLVVPEITNEKFAIYDIDEVEAAILDILKNSRLVISNILELLKNYFEEDVIDNHQEEYQKLVITYIKQLVLKKALKSCS